MLITVTRLISSLEIWKKIACILTWSLRSIYKINVYSSVTFLQHILSCHYVRFIISLMLTYKHNKWMQTRCWFQKQGYDYKFYISELCFGNGCSSLVFLNNWSCFFCTFRFAWTGDGLTRPSKSCHTSILLRDKSHTYFINKQWR